MISRYESSNKSRSVDAKMSALLRVVAVIVPILIVISSFPEASDARYILVELEAAPAMEGKSHLSRRRSSRIN